VGLIAHALEAEGIPTLCMSSAWSITASVNPPRATFLDFPLGHTSGRPGRPEEQLEILRDVLRAFANIETPGTIVRLPYSWGEDWRRAEPRETGDARTERSDTPVYQSEADRSAALARFGESRACRGCAAQDVPTR